MGCKLYLKAYLKRDEKQKDLGMLQLWVILAFKFICKYIIERSHLIFNKHQEEGVGKYMRERVQKGKPLSTLI